MDRIAILKLNGFLLVTIQVEMHDQLVLTLQDELTVMLSNTQASGVLIDISALDIVDSFVARALAQIAAIGRVMNAATVLVGMRPSVAITLVELGVPLKGVLTAVNVDKGMQLLHGSGLAAEARGAPSPARAWRAT
jgi:rsbT antagonist protein RsbS